MMGPKGEPRAHSLRRVRTQGEGGRVYQPGRGLSPGANQADTLVSVFQPSTGRNQCSSPRLWYLVTGAQVHSKTGRQHPPETKVQAPHPCILLSHIQNSLMASRDQASHAPASHSPWHASEALETLAEHAEPSTSWTPAQFRALLPR